MRKSDNRLSKDIDSIHSEEFAEVCRNGNPKVLIRRRKMPLFDLLVSMITRKATSLALELRNYMKISHPGIKISKPGYLKQRMKLNPEAFKDLFQFHNRNFYNDPEEMPDTYKDYLVLAADGTTAIVPTTEETLDVYGDFSRKGVKKCAQVDLSCISDVLNNLILELDIKSAKFNESAVAIEQAKRIKDTVGDRYPFMIVMDRGYPSLPLFLEFIDNNIYFVARLNSYCLKKEQESMTSNDEDFIVEITSQRRDRHAGKPTEDLVNSHGSFPLRIVRVTLDDERCEYLATNLSRDDFTEDDFGELYHLRWKIETTFETLKDRLQLENFTGTKPILIEQDIYSTVYVHNLSMDIIRDVEKEDADRLNNRYKHKMTVNKTLSIGILKNDLIYIILQDDPDVRAELMQQLYDDISQNIVPIREDRHYERHKGTLVGKHHNTHKRCF